jgi:hypothetical protein
MKCLWKTPPGLSVGFSLANPTTSFYGGISLELVRNVQLVLGVNTAKVATYSSKVTQTNQAISGGTPLTVQRFSTSAFVGLTFNVSGFVQSQFGSSGASGSGKGSGSQTSSPSSSTSSPSSN